MAVGDNEKILLNYLHEIEYNNIPANAIGATTSTTLRTIPTIAGTTYHVRKFGKQFSETDITGIFPPFVNLTIKIYTLDGTLIGSRAFGGAFEPEGTASTEQGIYVEFEASGAATTNISMQAVFPNAGAVSIKFPAETMGAGETIRFYISETGSSYYDADMKYGGARHIAAGTEVLPDFTITAAYARLAATDGVQVDDSETYDEELTTASGQPLDTATTAIFAKLGQVPKITRGIGARITRDVSAQWNNITAVYFNENGNDANPGTWQEPFETPNAAIAGRGAKSVVYGGTDTPIVSSYIGAVVDINGAFTFESDYGNRFIIESASSLDITNAAGNVYGIEIKSVLDITNVNYSGNIDDNIFVGLFPTGAAKGFTGNIRRNRIKYLQFLFSDGAPHGGEISSNIITGGPVGTFYDGIHITIGAASPVVTTIVNNNIIYDIDSGAPENDGIYFEIDASSFNGTCENNICFNNEYGIGVGAVGTYTGTMQNNICWDNSVSDLRKLGPNPVTINNSCWLTNAGMTPGAGNVATDPEFISKTDPKKFGLSSNSPCYRTDSNADDMGVHLRCVEVDNSDITINGFYIDGQGQYNNAIFIADAVDHTGLNVKWNSVYSFNGIALDPYDNNVDTDMVINNNSVHDNGNGIKLSLGGNTLEENLIYNNTVFGIWSDYTGQTFNHNVFYGNQHGLHLDVKSALITLTNNIFSQNSDNDIFSEVAVAATYCCLDGIVNANVDISSDTNVLSDPFFIDPAGTDYNIKTVEAGYIIDSPCKDVAADGFDIGAYKLTRSVNEEAWRKYQLAWNPRKLDPEYNGKGIAKFEDALGITNMFEKSHLRIYPFQWDRTQSSTEELWKKVQYFSSLVPDRDQGRTADQCRIRVNPLPSQLLLSGTAATINAGTKTILDINLDLTEDELKGFWTSIKYLSGTGMAIDAAAKTGTVTGSPWVVNAWAGYYMHHLGYYLLIKSNTANVITLSDPNGVLENGITIWAFEKYFKMIKTENQILHLQDKNGELITGTYDYYVDFIEMHVVKPGFKTLQERFYWLQETWKTGFNLFLEEL